MVLSSPAFFAMKLPERLAALRKERGLTQLTLADQVGLAVLQIAATKAAPRNLPWM
jgi:transcriptional regulator with XRE-family HTH domain